MHLKILETIFEAIQKVIFRGGSRTAAICKMELFVSAIWRFHWQYYIAAVNTNVNIQALLNLARTKKIVRRRLHFGYCSSPRSASDLVC